MYVRFLILPIFLATVGIMADSDIWTYGFGQLTDGKLGVPADEAAMIDARNGDIKKQSDNLNLSSDEAKKLIAAFDDSQDAEQNGLYLGRGKFDIGKANATYISAFNSHLFTAFYAYKVNNAIPIGIWSIPVGIFTAAKTNVKLSTFRLLKEK